MNICSQCGSQTKSNKEVCPDCKMGNKIWPPAPLSTKKFPPPLSPGNASTGRSERFLTGQPSSDLYLGMFSSLVPFGVYVFVVTHLAAIQKIGSPILMETVDWALRNQLHLWLMPVIYFVVVRMQLWKLARGIGLGTLISYCLTIFWKSSG